MAKQIREDFLLNPDGDFPLQDTVQNGVWMNTPYGLSDNQHIKDILFYNKGDLKQFPTLGCSVDSYLNSEFSINEIKRNIDIDLDKDDYKSKNGIVKKQGNDGFIIDTSYVIRK